MSLKTDSITILQSLYFNTAGAQIGFNPTVYSVVEGGAVIITIENMTPDLERDVTVQFYTIDRSAVGM